MLYEVSFENNLPDSTGHMHRCKQQAIAVDARSASDAIDQAIVMFELSDGIDRWNLHAQIICCVEKAACNGS